MGKPRKSTAKNLNQELWDQFVALDMQDLFVREWSFAPDYPTWIFHKPKGGKWHWGQTNEKRRWRADFACVEAKLLIECDGGTFQMGGHNTGAALENQNNRQNEAMLNGWMILRVTRRMIEETVALDLITKALSRRIR